MTKDTKTFRVDSKLISHSGKPKELSTSQKKKLKQRIAQTTFSIPPSFWEGRPDKEILEQALGEKYASTR